MADDALAQQLFGVRNAFHLGNFTLCINEAQKQKASMTDDAALLASVYMYRAMVAQGKYNLVMSEIGTTAPSDLCAVRTLARFFQSGGERAAASEEILKLATDTVTRTNPTVQLVNATMLMASSDCEGALTALSQVNEPECTALAVQILLQMDRLDLARKELKKLQEMDDDATITQLATAWVDFAVGGEKYQEAFYIYQELTDKYGATVMLLNGQASAYMHQGNWSDAEEVLLQAQDKASDDVDTLSNLLVCSLHLGKGRDVVARLIAQLKDSAPTHPFVARLIAKENELANIAASYHPTVPV